MVTSYGQDGLRLEALEEAPYSAAAVFQPGCRKFSENKGHLNNVFDFCSSFITSFQHKWSKFSSEIMLLISSLN